MEARLVPEAETTRPRRRMCPSRRLVMLTSMPRSLRKKETEDG